MPRTAGARWYGWLTLISGVALVPPVIWIAVANLHASPIGDAQYFHEQARLISTGAGWFISPFPYLVPHQVVQSAQHPPLWTLLLAVADLVGLTSYPSQLFFSCVIGAGAVFVIGLAGRELSGPRVGLIAAAIAAVYPNYWINYGLGLSETLILLLIALVVLLSLQFWRRPSARKAVALGVVCALAAMTRAEQVLLVVAVIVPMALVSRTVPMRRRIAYAAVGIVTASVVVTPWVGFNLSRFSHPTIFSTDPGPTLAAANCRSTYYGAYLGAGDFRCLQKISSVPGDESALASHLQRVAFRYIDAHLGRVPVVMVARVGRELGLYRPFSELNLERSVDGRPLLMAELGLFMYYGLAIAAVFGAVVLRRKAVTLVPLVGIMLEVIGTTTIAFGDTRYRAPLEVVIVLGAAVAVDALVDSRSRRGVIGDERGAAGNRSVVPAVVDEAAPQER